MRQHEVHFKLHEAELPLKNKVGAPILQGMLRSAYQPCLAMLRLPLTWLDLQQK